MYWLIELFIYSVFICLFISLFIIIWLFDVQFFPQGITKFTAWPSRARVYVSRFNPEQFCR